MAQVVKYLPALWETQVQSLSWEDPLEKEMAPTLVFLPGEFHGQRSLNGLQSMGVTKSQTWLSHSLSQCDGGTKETLQGMRTKKSETPSGLLLYFSSRHESSVMIQRDFQKEEIVEAKTLKRKHVDLCDWNGSLIRKRGFIPILFTVWSSLSLYWPSFPISISWWILRRGS